MFLLTGPNIVCRPSKKNIVCRFIVHGGSPGLKINKIENKMSLRVVQNCNIQLENVFVPDDDRLPGTYSFQDLVDVRKSNCFVDD
jgi:acyl-CoA oxidase